MKTSEIRDKMLAERALYLQSVKDSDNAIKKISGIIAEISEEEIRMLSEIGVDCKIVKGFDLQRMKQDKEYLTHCSSKLQDIINKLHNYLEAELNV